MKLFKVFLLAMITLSNSYADSSVKRIDNPTYPGTNLPFMVFELNVLKYGGSDHYNDEVTSVCRALGFELAVGPFNGSMVKIDQLGVRVFKYTEGVTVYDILSPDNLSFGYKQIKTIKCLNQASHLPVQKIKLFSSSMVQKLLKSKLPVSFSNADPFCKSQGFDIAGSENINDGIVKTPTATKINYVVPANDGTYRVASQKMGYPESVLCTGF